VTIRLLGPMTAHDLVTGQTFVTLPLRLVSEANVREHWRPRAKRAATQRSIARMLVGQAIGGRNLPAIVTLTRIAPRELDGDNLQRACKAVRDGVADALGCDDRDPRINWQYAQERAGVNEYGVRITLEFQRASDSAQ